MSEGSSYDDIPYPAYAMPEAHPDRLGAMGRIFGLNTRDPATAHVLEIGCSDGGHLLPFAAAAPGARCVGIDPSGAQIEAARSTQRALGLDNTTLIAAGIEDLPDPEAPYDYIICHGVYSWVPEPVRERILQVMRRWLAPGGVAYLSYNVWPGWALRGRLRALATRGGTLPALRRWMDALANVPSDAELPLVHLAEVARELAPMSDSYLAHEYLETDNEPRWFAEVAGAARRHGLQILSDASLGAQVGVGYSPALMDALRARSRGLVHVEQLLDLLGGRTFHQTLLVRDDEGMERNLLSFHPACVRWSTRGRWDGEALVDDDDALRIDPSSEVARAALSRLAARRPETVDLGTLAPGATEDDARALGQLLLRGVSLGLIYAHAFTFPATAHAGHHPLAWAPTRLAASTDWRVPSARHETLSLDPLERLVVVYADGSRDLPTLTRDIAHAAQQWPVTRALDIRDEVIAQVVQRLTASALFVRADSSGKR